MNDLESRRHQSFNRILNFAAVNAEFFSASLYGSQLIAELRNIVDQLNIHAKAQEKGALSSQQGTSNRAVLRDELRRDLSQISRTARSIAVEKLGIDETFRLGRNLNDQQLLNSARRIAEDAAPHMEDFIRLEMPKDFLEQLNKNIALFKQAVDEQQQGMTKQVTATAEIDKAIERGIIIAGILDSIVRNRFEDDSAALAAWVNARHTQRAPRAAPTAPATNAPTVADIN